MFNPEEPPPPKRKTRDMDTAIGNQARNMTVTDNSLIKNITVELDLHKAILKTSERM